METAVRLFVAVILRTLCPVIKCMETVRVKRDGKGWTVQKTSMNAQSTHQSAQPILYVKTQQGPIPVIVLPVILWPEDFAWVSTLYSSL